MERNHMSVLWIILIVLLVLVVFGGYGFSLLWGGIISTIAIPFLAASRAQRDPADTAVSTGEISGDGPPRRPED